jgi:hypothetical protein
MYKGRQKMICRIKKNGETVAQAEHIVRIAGGWFGRG